MPWTTYDNQKYHSEGRELEMLWLKESVHDKQLERIEISELK